MPLWLYIVTGPDKSGLDGNEKDDEYAVRVSSLDKTMEDNDVRTAACLLWLIK